MKPLVYYCRWQGACLRLRGRDKTAVWGQLVFVENEIERAQKFHFDLNSRQLTVENEGTSKTIPLDEMGVVK